MNSADFIIIGGLCCWGSTGLVKLFSVLHLELAEPHNSVNAQDTKCPL
jgi:hypothetical protein